uniref:Methylthioribose-1-phosphate isomerase n=1 Tax=Haemonchus contortus TaxID=6289 RepID=A0A7I4Z7W1_HAECO
MDFERSEMKFIVKGPIPTEFMKYTKRRLSAYNFDKEKLELTVLDQLLLPHKIVNIPIKNTKDAFDVIKKMQVRGAPLIAVVGVLGLFIEMQRMNFWNPDQFVSFIEEKAKFLVESRPTAINLRNALEHVLEVARKEGNEDIRKRRVAKNILKLISDEYEENRRLIWNGFQEILTIKTPNRKYVLMTICNTGSLATSSWGTALGVIQALHQSDLVEMVYALETRPYNQGIRLTASELREAGIPFKMITDNSVAWVMQRSRVDAILVGADQVALNGDTANKIGTYMLAVLAKRKGVPFYAVVPFTTVNPSISSGKDITIEERPPAEMISINGKFIVPEETPVWNPAFDITPAELITKIVTDRGNFSPKDLKYTIENTMSDPISSLLENETPENYGLIYGCCQELLALKPAQSKLVLMTICSQKTLDTSICGKVFHVLHQTDQLEMIYLLETRPCTQELRARVTEFLEAKIPFKLITDSMAGWAMKTHPIHAVLIEPDQVGERGNILNTTGTHTLAVLAEHHKVPFYAVVSIASVRETLEKGYSEDSEARPAIDVLSVNGELVGTEDTPVLNPITDHTPSLLVTKIITDLGSFVPRKLLRAVANSSPC